MSVALQIPDLRRILTDLTRRVGILERRTTSGAAASTMSLAHPGTGTNSVVVEPTGAGSDASATNTVAIGVFARAWQGSGTAVGDNAQADGSQATAVGYNAQASADTAAAFGPNANAFGIDALSLGSGASCGGDSSVAIGSGAVASDSNAVAVGHSATTTNDNQIMLGKAATGAFDTNATRTVMNAPNAAITSADLNRGQFSFYLDESGNNLVVKVRYSDNITVKTGTVPLT